MTLKKKWFDMILSGEKLEEYRTIKPYWDKRLATHYDAIEFVNGYSPDSPRFVIEFESVKKGLGLIDWGAEPYVNYYIIRLGKILSKNGVQCDIV